MTKASDALFPWEIPDDGAAGHDATGTTQPAPPPPAVPLPPDMRLAKPDGRAERRDDRAVQERTDADAPVRDRPVAQKEYYSISEVCEIVGLKPHVLRYWETQFHPLNPSKNRSGNRVYQRKEIKLILLVKHLLYEEKYTVEGARAKLDRLRRTGRMNEMTGRALALDTAAMVRTELERLVDALSVARPV